MTFDPSTSLWTASGVALTAGTNFKFVSNSDWNNQYGLDSKGEPPAGQQRGQYPRHQSGTFTITLDLSQAAGTMAIP